ncbi:hypothetical protein [Actinoplanes xinjiangensis]|uniref:Uncharacterized protein n=1 Tax=Actinoplanes xinjiangensis TaxID=512350 RepID=A0A316FVF9_9ACTN|nr:hypothetical protein [Actinoplanes xinjiangensis]PWK51580.1 hypothetical protein BC793_102616 [Actinoplanes xinjiangensis]GIF35941.1 hypothetical protein Axi01nite_02520 [Actinoplanes xinjiangensis]
MSARPLPAELAAVRALVADGLAEIGDAGDTGQVWLRSATARLTAFDQVVTEAAGVLAAPTRLILVTLATFLVVAGSAALAGALGLGSGGTLALSGTTLLIMFATIPWAGRHVYTLTGRRRLARAAAHLSPRPVRATSPEAGLAGVPDRLLQARVRLVSAALRQAGAGNWSAPELRRAIRTDPVVRRLAHADQLLCQAVDCVERHLGDLRKDPP